MTARMGLLFQPTTLALSAATISKVAAKPPASPRLTAVVAIPNSIAIEYDAVALELVREHPHRLIESGSRQQPRQRTNTMVDHRTLPPSPLWAGTDAKEDRVAQGWRRV